MKYARAYTYRTDDPYYININGTSIQTTRQWFALTSLLHKLGITVLY